MNWKVAILLVLCPIVIFGCSSFFLMHPWFRIEQVDVYGTEYLHRTDFEGDVTSYMNEHVGFFFKKSNQFLFSSESLSEELLKNFALASISIGVTEGHLSIRLEERTSNLLWKTQGKLYVVDLQGIVIREVINEEDEIFTQTNVSELPIFIDKNDVRVEIGSVVLQKNEVDQAFIFLTYLQEAGIEYSYTEVDRVAGKWVKIVAKDDFGILIDLTGDIQSQYDNLALILTDQVKDTSTLEYIDLRFGDKVYYK
ncbi:hypothetical protein HQ487_00830 [Candidatus Uhrbacteria bacterium]|nr:hypothetical protein [Candidatus Uhrbacteria bacterium]